MDLDYGSEAVAAKKSKKPRLVSSDEEIELEENDAPNPPPFNAEVTARNLFFPHYRFKYFLKSSFFLSP
jgi:hypothetical protein